MNFYSLWQAEVQVEYPHWVEAENGSLWSVYATETNKRVFLVKMCILLYNKDISEVDL